MSMLLDPVNQGFDVFICRNTLDVTNEDKHSSRSSNSHIHSSPIFQKANISFWIASDHGDYDTLFLSTLNAIDSWDIYEG